jgi:hypothetical protein
LEEFVRKMMGNVSSATPWCVLAPLCGFVMSAIMDPSKVDVLFVEEWESLMLTIAKSAHSWRKIGMDVQKSLI